MAYRKSLLRDSKNTRTRITIYAKKKRFSWSGAILSEAEVPLLMELNMRSLISASMKKCILLNQTELLLNLDSVVGWEYQEGTGTSGRMME